MFRFHEFSCHPQITRPKPDHFSQVSIAMSASHQTTTITVTKWVTDSMGNEEEIRHCIDHTVESNGVFPIESNAAFSWHTQDRLLAHKVNGSFRYIKFDPSKRKWKKDGRQCCTETNESGVGILCLEFVEPTQTEVGKSEKGQATQHRDGQSSISVVHESRSDPLDSTRSRCWEDGSFGPRKSGKSRVSKSCTTDHARGIGAGEVSENGLE